MKTAISYNLVDGRELLRLVEGDELAAEALILKETTDESIIEGYDTYLLILHREETRDIKFSFQEPKGEPIEFRMGSVSNYEIDSEEEYSFLRGKLKF